MKEFRIKRPKRKHETGFIRLPDEGDTPCWQATCSRIDCAEKIIVKAKTRGHAQLKMRNFGWGATKKGCKPQWRCPDHLAGRSKKRPIRKARLPLAPLLRATAEIRSWDENTHIVYVAFPDRNSAETFFKAIDFEQRGG